MNSSLIIIVGSPRLRISRVQEGILDTEFLSHPMFYIASRTDSGIDLPDLNVTDEKFLNKYGSDLTANFADIRAYGSKAFFEKENLSDGMKYSLCTCATGYIVSSSQSVTCIWWLELGEWKLYL